MKNNVRLTKEEKKIENDIIQGDFLEIPKSQLKKIEGALIRRKKDAVLNIRINSEDLDLIKKKADRIGVKYQTYISEVLHRIAS